MREIKFRAWDTEEKQFVTHSRVIESNILALEQNGQGRLVFQQYIGLKDKKGVEVYEGDIIEDDLEYLAVVKFGEHLTSTDYYASTAYGWYAEQANGDTHSLAQCGTIAVRGNIHEHPHLLERSVEG